MAHFGRHVKSVPLEIALRLTDGSYEATLVPSEVFAVLSSMAMSPSLVIII